MGVERRIGEAFSIILPKELAVTQTNVVDLVSRAASIHPLPLLWWHLPFPRKVISEYLLFELRRSTFLSWTAGTWQPILKGKITYALDNNSDNNFAANNVLFLF